MCKVRYKHPLMGLQSQFKVAATNKNAPLFLILYNPQDNPDNFSLMNSLLNFDEQRKECENLLDTIRDRHRN